MALAVAHLRGYNREVEGDMRAFIAVSALVLAGCSSHSSAYTRTDGVPVDPLHQQATLAQCKGEGAIAIPHGDVWQQEKIIAACMARNGYIHAQQ